MATAQHKLNVLAAATFPLMAVATLFGMNLIHGLEGRPFYCWLVFAAGCGVGVLTMQWVMRQSRS
jgi:Mg2+ and Co2+ transporter CorA